MGRDPRLPGILCVIGTRPEVIKMAPLYAALADARVALRPLLCSTGQHRELLTPHLELFGLRPDFELEIFREGQSLAQATARALTGLDAAIVAARPAWVLSVGDTTTAFVAALAAHYRQVRFGHVEAGLRTGDRYAPFPEEMNRRLVDHLAEVWFAPTATARATLLAEGFAADRIHVTGNTGIDALLQVARRHSERSAAGRRLVVVTVHRRENLGAGVHAITRAVERLAGSFPDVDFLWPWHPNPSVRVPIAAGVGATPNVRLVEPLGYTEMVTALRRASLVLTDSGGLQEEAPALDVPVLVLRETTERPEGIAAGVSQLVGTGTEAIVAAASRLLEDEAARQAMIRGGSPYGDGRAAERIVRVLADQTAENAPPRAA